MNSWKSIVIILPVLLALAAIGYVNGVFQWDRPNHDVEDRWHTEIDQAAQQAIIREVEDINPSLPINYGDGVTLDSVTAGQGSKSYYYTVEELTHEQVMRQQQMDSLQEEAVDRIPCTLWRPTYMDNVEVSFIYYSSDHREIFSFSKLFHQCCDE